MINARKLISLDGEWHFAYTRTAPDIQNIVFPKETDYETKLPVPAYWDDCTDILRYTKIWSRGVEFNPDYRGIEFPMGGLKPPDASLPYIIGTGWYKKSIIAGKDWYNKSIYLCIDGAQTEIFVWVNRHFAGSHYGCNSPFEVQLGDYIVSGEKNEIIIAVSNIRKDRMGCGIRGFKGRSAGITGSVSLEISEGARITDCYVHCDNEMENLIWEVKTDAKQNDGLDFDWSILLDGDKIAEGNFSADNNPVIMKAPNLIPWSDANPVLYEILLTLKRNGKIIDNIRQSYGFRYIRSEGEVIYLNDKPVLLRGLTDHAYFPETCTIPRDLGYYMKTIKALKELGFNWMRFHTAIPPEECMQAADMLGMMIQAETQNGFDKSDFINMIERCRKHPSVVLFCCGNEVAITDEVEEKLRQMSEICHSMAPDCMYDPMEAMLRVECIFDDYEKGYNETPTPHNYLKLDRIRKYSDVMATAVWLFSYEALEDDMNVVNNRLSIYKRPCLIHEAGIFDTYLNLDLENRYKDTRIGTDLYRAVRKYLEKENVIKNAPTYYKNSCKWMMEQTKFAIEKARRTKSVGGYDFLGATDHHWHRTGYAVGMMNEFYEIKPGMTVEQIRQFNGESVLLSDLGHERNFVEGQEIKVEISVSLYNGKDIQDAQFIWQMVDKNGYVRVSGHKNITDIENGKVTSVAMLKFIAPDVKASGEHMKLRVQLISDECSICNDWDFWVFANSSKRYDNVRIINELTDEDIEYMECGGRVFLMGKGPFNVLPLSYKIVSGGRVDGNCATVIYDHDIVREYPHDGYCSHQFYNMIEGAEAVYFNDLQIDFNPIIEVVSTYKMVRRQSVLFELKVGKGGLVVCTLNINQNDAAA